MARIKSALGRLVGHQRAISAVIAAMLIALPFAFFLTDDAAPVAQSDTGSECSAITTQLLQNPGFEDPAIPNRRFRIMHQDNIPGWSTTASDRRMELWSDGFRGVPAFAGRQFAELNANRVGTVYQDIPTIPGAQVTYTAAHRGRSGVDVFDIQIGPPSGPLISQSGGAGYADDNTAWGVYTDTYTVPAGQTVTRFAFASISSTGSASYGNFLDITNFASVTLQACPDTNATYANTAVDGAAFGNDASIDDINLDSYGQPANGSVVMRPDGTYTYTPDPDFVGIDSFPYTVTDNSGNTVTTTVTISVTTAPLAILEQSKSVVVLGGGDAVDGSRLRYTVTTTNVGNDDATGAVVRDPIPVGATYVDGSLSVVTASSTTIGAVSDEAGDDLGFFTGSGVGVNVGVGASPTAGGTLEPGATVTIQFDVTVAAGTAPGQVTNTSSADYVSDTLGAVNSTNSDPVTTDIAALADLSVTKSAAPDPIVAGETATYTVIVSNAGPSAADDVVVTDTLPSGVTLRSVVPSAGSCSAGTTTCSIGTLAAGSSARVAYTVAVDADLDANLLGNTASTTTSTNQTNTANDTVTISTPVVTSADLEVTKVASSDPLVPGDVVTWTIEVANAGPSTARNVSISDTLPVGVELTSATPSAGSCVDGSVECELGDLSVGASATVTVVAAIDSSYVEDDLANTVTVDSDTNDPTDDDNTATSTSSIAPSADLVVSKVAETDPIVPGSPATWAYTVRNAGPSDAAGVTSADVAPAGVSWTAASTTLGSCTVSATDVICDHGALPAGGTITVRVTGDVDPSATTIGATLRNEASAATTTTESEMANNRGSVDTAVTAQVDLRTTKSASPDPVIAGSGLTYTIAVENLGPSDATGVVVTDPLPTGVSPVGAPTTTTGTCGETDRTIVCEAGTLSVGETMTITIPATVDSGESGPIVNTATVDSDHTDPQTPRWSSTVDRQADLQLTKTGPATITAGETGDWSFSVINAGPSDASGVELTDALPDGFSIVAVPDACTAPSPTSLSCAWDSLAAGESASVIVTLRADASLAAGPSANAASVTAATPSDPSTDNNTSTWNTDVDRRADVAIAKSGPAVLEAGRSVTYTIAVRNAGPSSASDTTITDLLADGLSFDADASDDRCTAVGSLVTCDLGELAPGSGADITIVAAVPSALIDGSSVENTAQISTSTPDPDDGNDRSTTAGTVRAVADLQVSKSGPTAATAGAEASWTVTVTNLGPADAADAIVTDPAPAGVTWNSITPNSALLDCTVATGSCATPDLSTIPAGASIEITYTGVIDADLAAGTIFNSAAVSSTTTDPNGDNDRTTASSPVEVSADIEVAKTATDDAPVAGTETGWTITVRNAGPSIATGVVVADVLPDDVSFVELSTSSGGCDIDTGICELGDVAVGSTVTIGVTGLLAPSIDAGTELINTASASSATPDPDIIDNRDDARSTAVSIADLAITKSATTPTGVAGESATWLLEVVNLGPSDADSVIVTDPLPVGVVASSVTVETDTGSCVVAEGDVTCELGTIGLAGVAIIRVSGEVASSIDPGSIIENTAAITSAAIDPVTDNDRSTDSIEVSATADLSIVKSFTGTALVAGDSTATWDIVVTNNGPSDAAAVTVVDVLPDTATATSIVPSAGLCDLDALSCDVGNIADGETVTIKVAATIAADHVGSLTNIATVDSATTDPAPDDNTSSISTPVATTADLVVDKSLDATMIAGTTASWTITVTNLGPSIARDVVLDDTPSSGVAAVSIETDQGDCTLDGVCALGDLAVDQTVTITYAASIDAGQAGPVANTATVDSSTDDPDAGNDLAVVESPVAASADLAIDKVVNGPIIPGLEAAWTITVVNNGPSTARDITVTDIAAAGIVFSSVTSDRGDCSIEGICSIDELEVGDRATIVVNAPIGDTQSGIVSNSATVSAETDDPEASNDRATIDTPVSQQSELSVTKVADETSAEVGTDVTWSISVTNEGPSTAADVVVTEQIPDGLTLLSATPDVGTWDEDTRVWSVGTLAVGETVRLEVVTNTDVAGVLTNVATASSSTPVGGLGASVIAPSEVQAEAEATVEVSSQTLTPPRTPRPLPFTGSDPMITVVAAALMMLLGGGLMRVRTVGARTGRRR